MAYTTINNGSLFMNPKLYTGNGGTQSITGVGFQPDFTWLKSRSAVYEHALFDAVRGTGKLLASNNSDAEYSGSNLLTAFGTDGFSLGDHAPLNNNGTTYASWNWKANGTGSANTAGSISSTVSANTTSGFSIVSYTGNGTAGATVGHGLGSVPSMVIVKKLSASGTDWFCYHKSLGNTYYIPLNTTAVASANIVTWNNTTPTSSVFSLGISGTTNASSASMIAYCFADVQGYSKFGSYTGNGNVDGTFCYTGFKPAFVIVKKTSATNNWVMMDNKRDPFNMMTEYLLANDSGAEGTGLNFDFLSNGFKLRSASSGTNTSGATYIYMAFAEAPLVGTNNIPANAR